MTDIIYKYFIGFCFTKGSRTGFGNLELGIMGVISSIDDIKAIEGLIADTEGFEMVKVLSYSLLDAIAKEDDYIYTDLESDSGWTFGGWSR